MQIKTETFTFTLLTPCFGGTALGRLADHAEMRVPPIRGHVRMWSHALYGAEVTNRVWGNAAGETGHGSLVALRFLGPVPQKQKVPKPTLLPHKEDAHKRGPRPALDVNQQYTLGLQLLVGCSEIEWQKAQNAVRLWMLVGCLGLRSNRAAGSVWPVHPAPPTNINELRERLRTELRFRWIVKVGTQPGLNPDVAREIASDTVHGGPFGSSNPRIPSPVKFKVIRLGDEFKLMAMAKAENDISEVMKRLSGRNRWKNLKWESL